MRIGCLLDFTVTAVDRNAYIRYCWQSEGVCSIMVQHKQLHNKENSEYLNNHIDLW